MRIDIVRHPVLSVVFFALLSGAFAQQPEQHTAESQFAEGMRLLDVKQYSEALSAFTRSASLNDKNPAAFANIGSIQMRLQQFSFAETAFRTAFRLSPRNGNFSASLCLALSMQDKHEPALKACEEGVRLSPESAYAAAALIEATAMSGRNVESLFRLIDLALAKFASDVQILEVSAYVAIRSRQFRFAEELLIRLTELEPRSAEYVGRLAEVQLRMGKDAEALASARRALSLDRRDPYANFSLGLVFFELGGHEEAVESFSLVPSNTKWLEDAAYYQALSEGRRGRHRVAVELLRNLTMRDSDNGVYFKQLGRSLLDTDDPESAVAAYRRANDLIPNDPEILSGYGMSFMNSYRFEEAIKQFGAAVALSAENKTFQMFLNVARARQQIPAYLPGDKALADSDPRDVKVRVELVRQLAFIGRIEEAETYVKQIYELDPKDPLIFVHIGVAYAEARNSAKAVQAYKKAIEKGEYFGAYRNLAGELAKAGEAEAASAAYEKAIGLNAGSWGTMHFFANHLRDNGKRREALEMYKRSLALSPNNAAAIFEAGLLSLKLGDRETALVYLEQLKVLDPRSAATLARCLRSKVWG